MVTAVEWLAQKLDIAHDNPLFEQAKAMEKEQIKDAFANGVTRHLHGKVILSEQYYKETYGK